MTPDHEKPYPDGIMNISAKIKIKPIGIRKQSRYRWTASFKKTWHTDNWARSQEPIIQSDFINFNVDREFTSWINLVSSLNPIGHTIVEQWSFKKCDTKTHEPIHENQYTDRIIKIIMYIKNLHQKWALVQAWTKWMVSSLNDELRPTQYIDDRYIFIR